MVIAVNGYILVERELLIGKNVKFIQFGALDSLTREEIKAFTPQSETTILAFFLHDGNILTCWNSRKQTSFLRRKFSE